MFTSHIEKLRESKTLTLTSLMIVGTALSLRLRKMIQVSQGLFKKLLALFFFCSYPTQYGN